MDIKAQLEAINTKLNNIEKLLKTMKGVKSSERKHVESTHSRGE